MTRRTRGSRWTRKELLAVLYFYLKYKPELTSPQNHPLIENLAKAMGRTVSSIAMRIANYKSVDPADSGRGLEAGGPYMKIWREYEDNPDRVLAEARQAYQDFIPTEISKDRRVRLQKSPNEKQTSGKNTEERYKVIEASDRASLEIQLNEEADWKLHSFSVATNPARSGTSSQKMVIVAVLERPKTTIDIASGD